MYILIQIIQYALVLFTQYN